MSDPTPEDCLRWAREAGFGAWYIKRLGGDYLQRFAALAHAAGYAAGQIDMQERCMDATVISRDSDECRAHIRDLAIRAAKDSQA